jgi:hypothetical protein
MSANYLSVMRKKQSWRSLPEGASLHVVNALGVEALYIRVPRD